MATRSSGPGGGSGEAYSADFAAHFNLGALQLNRNEVLPAIDSLRKALRAEPEQPVALNTMGSRSNATINRGKRRSFFAVP
jgi:Tfp pilus assembly protein PilF